MQILHKHAIFEFHPRVSPLAFLPIAAMILDWRCVCTDNCRFAPTTSAAAININAKLAFLPGRRNDDDLRSQEVDQRSIAAAPHHVARLLLCGNMLLARKGRKFKEII